MPRLEAAVERLYENCSDTDSLVRLAELAGLAPDMDFEGADLRELKVAGEDLTAFSFRDADLRGSDMRGARLSRTALEGALLEGALLDEIVWVGDAELDRRLLGGSGKNWSEISAKTLEDWIARVAPVDGKYRMSLETTRGFQRGLPFYENTKMFAFTDESWGNRDLIIYYLQNEGDVFRLNGTSPPIHKVNAKAPIHLSEDNILDYVRFFCSMVHGEEGPFCVLEAGDDPFLPEEMDDKTRHIIAGSARPATYDGMTESGNYLVAATIFYSNALFVANFVVEPTGMIRMNDDEPVAAGLPVRIKMPLA